MGDENQLKKTGHGRCSFCTQSPVLGMQLSDQLAVSVLSYEINPSMKDLRICRRPSIATRLHKRAKTLYLRKMNWNEGVEHWIFEYLNIEYWTFEHWYWTLNIERLSQIVKAQIRVHYEMGSFKFSTPCHNSLPCQSSEITRFYVRSKKNQPLTSA